MNKIVRCHLLFFIACALGLTLSRIHAQAPAASAQAPAVPKDLHLYLLIGGSNMAGRAEVPQDAGEIIDRCYLLNDKNEWVPARNPLNRYSSAREDLAIQKLGPGYSFVRKMLEQDKTISIGLIVNAYGDSKIDQWFGKSELYWGARKGAKAAMRSGTMKGILWHQGESDQKAADGYLDKLQTLAANLRSDLADTGLPFIVGQIHNSPAINDQIAKLP